MNPVDGMLGIDQIFIPYKSHKDNRWTLVQISEVEMFSYVWCDVIYPNVDSSQMFVFLVMFDYHLQMFWSKLWL